MGKAGGAIAHGARVTVHATLVRVIEVRPGAKGSVSDLWKVWAPVPKGAPASGVFLGWRALRNGVRFWEGEEVGYTFTPKGPTIRAAVVSLSSTTNPVYVAADQLKVAPTPADDLVEAVQTLHAAASDLRHVARGGECDPRTLTAHADALLALASGDVPEVDFGNRAKSTEKSTAVYTLTDAGLDVVQHMGALPVRGGAAHG